MDKKLEQSLARKIVRATAKNMKPFGYVQGKPTFLCRAYPPHLIAFFHFHKFSFGPRFRVQFGIRVVNSGFDALGLNGTSIEHAGVYAEDDESVSRCVQMLTELLIRDGLPWAESWLDTQKLLMDADSPISERDCAELRNALEGHINPEHIALSYRLSGISPPNKSPEPTAVGAGRSAIAVHAASRRWLSFFR